MQNHQHGSSQNSKFLSPPTNTTIFPLPPTNPNIFYRPPRDTQSGEFTCYEPETSTGSMSECHVSQSSTQVGLENITFGEKKKKRSAPTKPRELFTRDEDIILIQT